MEFKLCFIMFTLNNYFFSTGVFGKRSFTMVVDSTVSMEEEIIRIKGNSESFLQSVDDWSEIENFILIPFTDPDVSPPIISTTQSGFVRSIASSLFVSGGGKCPENSLNAIELALAQSKPGSYIFVFTDAYAKDNNTLSSIINLCGNTHAQVYIFLSGNCINEGDVNVYYDIANSCAGSVLRLDPSDLRQAFHYMGVIIKMKLKWNDIISKQSFLNHKTLTFSVEPFTSGTVIEVSCDEANVQVTDDYDQKVIFETLFNTRQSKALYIKKLDLGTYNVSASCKKRGTLTVYNRKKFPFAFGFCKRLCQDIKETSSRPVTGSNYILIFVPKSLHVKLNELKMHLYDENYNASLTLQMTDGDPILYTSSAYFETNKSFVLSVTAENVLNHQKIYVSTNILEPQKLDETKIQWRKPNVEIIKPMNTTFEFAKNITIACRVTAYPAPHTWWETDSGDKMDSKNYLVETPDIYVDYLNVQNITSNFSIYCKSQNTLGIESDNMELIATLPYKFEVIQSPSDETIEYGEEGRLFCKVEAYPKAIIKWYHNKTLIESDDNLEILEEGNELLIKEMDLEDVGQYTCEVSNTISNRSFTASVTISNLEPPSIEIDRKEIKIKPGEQVFVECRIVKGIPEPDVSWQFKEFGGFEHKNVSEGVLINDTILQILNAKTEHSGVYTCTSVNDLGTDFVDITVLIEYAPIIRNDIATTIDVKEGDLVELDCYVDAQPPAKVKWEMSQDEVIIAFDERHSTDMYHTHRFEALWKDSGYYHCIAENVAGKAEKSIRVNVMVPPFIQTPEPKAVSIRTGSSATLSCNILYGNPVPSTKWEFIALNSSSTILSRKKSSSTLQLTKVSKDNAGIYICTAENQVGFDSIRISVKIY